MEGRRHHAEPAAGQACADSSTDGEPLGIHQSTPSALLAEPRTDSVPRSLSVPRGVETGSASRVASGLSVPPGASEADSAKMVAATQSTSPTSAASGTAETVEATAVLSETPRRPSPSKLLIFNAHGVPFTPLPAGVPLREDEYEVRRVLWQVTTGTKTADFSVYIT